MLLKKRKAAWQSVFALLGIVAACILLNFIGIRLNAMWGLPLFLDNIGTILAALLGGYIPCMTVGFLTNILVGLTDSFTIYYCIISVFIAAAAVFFREKKMLTRFPHVLLAIVTFAFLGGIAGGMLTWLINGFSFGEGFATDLAANINAAVPVGYIPSNLCSNFLIDFVDKGIVTVAAILLFFITPKKLKAFLARQSWYNLEVLKKSSLTNRGVSIRMKVTLLVALSTTLVAVAATGISILQFHNATIDRYEEEGKQVTAIISDTIDKSKIDAFLKEGRAAQGYAETENMLYAVRGSSPEIKYIYIYRVEEDGSHVIFDLETEDVSAAKAGDVIDYDVSIAKYRDLFLAGEDVPSDMTGDSTGWVLSVYEPVRDLSGKTLCYVCADLSMNRLLSEEFAFLAKIISLFMGFLIVIRTYAVWMAERWIISPINTIADAASRFSYDTAQAREESMQMIESLDITTGDEIENLYHAYSKTTADTVRYIDEVQEKGEQISKLQNGLIMVLADMVESRDKCTGDHVRKTAAYTEIILRQMQKEGIYADRLSEEYITEVINSAPLHDVGKIQVPDAILNKPGRLSDEEFKRIQSHTSAGGEIIDKAIALVDMESEYLTEAKNLATYHHEKWNGKGYPHGLSEEEIPLSARVMAVADVFDALVSRRSYKEPFTVDQALDIIREGSGNHFDPNVVKAFLDAEDEVRRVAALNMDI